MRPAEPPRRTRAARPAAATAARDHTHEPRTLWDLVAALIPTRRARPAPPPPTPDPPAPPRRAPTKPARRPGAATASMSDRYEQLTRTMLTTHAVRVRKWRTSMSGCAWTVTYRDGTVSRLIEAPRPKGPMSAAVFLHEIGHHALGIGAFRPRCLEEYHAWAWSLSAMEAHGITITDRVRQRMHDSLHYAVAKAQRRGLKKLPEELLPYLHPRPRQR
ncbi:MAG: hypothetical protein ACTS3F_02210 [Phycisphaerales bacterium]